MRTPLNVPWSNALDLEVCKMQLHLVHAGQLLRIYRTPTYIVGPVDPRRCLDRQNRWALGTPIPKTTPCNMHGGRDAASPEVPRETMSRQPNMAKRLCGVWVVWSCCQLSIWCRAHSESDLGSSDVVLFKTSPAVPYPRSMALRPPHPKNSERAV